MAAGKDLDYKKLVKEFDTMKKEFKAFTKDANEWKQGISENINTKLDTLSEDLTTKQSDFESSLTETFENEKLQSTSGETTTNEEFDISTSAFDVSL